LIAKVTHLTVKEVLGKQLNLLVCVAWSELANENLAVINDMRPPVNVGQSHQES
jgi:hypothetical protein